jgi:hemerythrin-like domain-containing protein
MPSSTFAAPRRNLLVGAAALGLAGCSAPDAGKPDTGKDVSAVEDLMREHGVLRRLLVVYREAAIKLAEGPAGFDGRQLWRAADLFRRFGEAYHEQQLEEQHIFPQVLKTGGEAARLVPILLGQHARGRQITGFVQGKTAAGGIAGSDAGPLASALTAFSRMYEPHAAYEDTIVFQAWRNSLSAKQLDEAGDQFEDIEKAAFKGDGFDLAVAEVAAIEAALGLHDLARYTAPAG